VELERRWLTLSIPPSTSIHSPTHRRGKAGCPQSRRLTIFRPDACWSLDGARKEASAAIEASSRKRSKSAIAAKYTVFRFYNRAGASHSDQPARCESFRGEDGLSESRSRMCEGKDVADSQKKSEARNTGPVTDLQGEPGLLIGPGSARSEETSWRCGGRLGWSVLPPHRSGKQLVTQGRLPLFRYAWRDRSDPGS